MSDDVKYIRDKLDTLATQVGELNLTLTRNTVILADHVRRTNILEKEVGRVDKHVTRVNAIITAIKWTVGVSAGLAGIVLTVWKLGL